MEYSAKQRDAMSQVLTEVLAQTRPQEVFLVGYVFENQTTTRRRSDGLAFGPEVEAILWMYPLLEVLKSLAAKAAEEFAKKWGEHLAEWIWAPKAGQKLNPSAMTALRDAVVARLAAEGVKPRESLRAGDCLLAVLVEKPELLRQIARG